MYRQSCEESPPLLFILHLLFLSLQRRHSPWWAATRERRQPSTPNRCLIKPKCSQPAPSMLHGFLRLQQNYFDTTVTSPQWKWEDGCPAEQTAHTQTGCHNVKAERERGRCTVSLTNVRSVHIDMFLSKTLVLWSHIHPKTFLRKIHIVKWFSHQNSRNAMQFFANSMTVFVSLSPCSSLLSTHAFDKVVNTIPSLLVKD